MKLTDLLKGKIVKIPTDAKVDVELEIEAVEEKVSHKTIQITPDTPENDWWGETKSYRDVSYLVTFTNGHKKEYKSIESINIIE
jgi:hypothetical protein